MANVNQKFQKILKKHGGFMKKDNSDKSLMHVIFVSSLENKGILSQASLQWICLSGMWQKESMN